MTISGVLNSEDWSMLLFQLLFLPVTFYFCFQLLIRTLGRRNQKNANNPASYQRSTATIVAIVFLLLLTVAIIKVNKPKPAVSKPKPNPTKTAKFTPKPTPVFHVVIKNQDFQEPINIYQNATSSSEIVGTANTSSKYQLVSEQNNWYKIVLNNNLKGFINKQFVKIVP